MPVSFEVQSQGGRYAVLSERDVLAARRSDMRAGVVIADEYFAPRLEADGVAAIALPAAESTKSFDALGPVIERLRDLGAGRDTRLWAVGGGTIQDAAAFVASVYMRGIGWSYVPSTLLGMVDSCIGGKSSINVGRYKNIVGTFHPPTTVLIDCTLIATLSVEQRIAGLIEAAKICYCRGRETFCQYLSFDPRGTLAEGGFDSIVELSLTAKKWFIEIDEFDRAERLLLNLGHTFGHALEGASDYRLSHGTGVGVGILCAAALSTELHGHPGAGAAASLEHHVRALLAEWPELPTVLRAIDADVVFKHLRSDKKHEARHYRFITFQADGSVEITRLAKTEEANSMVLRALRSTLLSLQS